MTARLTTREVRANIHVEGEEPVDLLQTTGKITAEYVAFRWFDNGDGWKLMAAYVTGQRHRADGTVGALTGRVQYADAWSPTGWAPNPPAWLVQAAQRLSPVTYGTPSELTPVHVQED